MFKNRRSAGLASANSAGLSAFLHIYHVVAYSWACTGLHVCLDVLTLNSSSVSHSCEFPLLCGSVFMLSFFSVGNAILPVPWATELLM